MHVLRRSIDSAPEVLSGLKFLRDWWGAYAKKGQMHCHLSWHLALWELELGNTQARGKSIVHPGASRGPPLNAPRLRVIPVSRRVGGRAPRSELYRQAWNEAIGGTFAVDG